MAEVVFFGIGPDGFPDPNTKLLPGSPPRSDAAKFFGVTPAPPGANNAVVQLGVTFAPSVPNVIFGTGIIPGTFSEQPNVNDIVFVVNGGPTLGALAVNVLVVPAVVPLGDGTIFQPGYVADDPRLFAGVNAPNGIVGKVATFLTPTGSNTFSAIKGQQGTVAAVGIATGFGAISPTGYAVVFTTALGIQPTNGDRFVITSDDRALRRTPLIEVILV